MKAALQAYLSACRSQEDHGAAVVRSAEALSGTPWAVVHEAGLLARCKVAVADRDLGLTPALRRVQPNSKSAAVRVDQGQPYPTLDHRGRRSRGAFDTPVDMARRVVRSAKSTATGPIFTGLDPACGTGAFLVAMAEAGIPEIYGTDLDPIAVEVARIAVPGARVHVEDALRHGPLVDIVCGNPPFVPPERQSKELRQELRRRFPWLRGRFDLVVPFAAVAAGRVRPGGALGLVLPTPVTVQPYASTLRRRWVQRHRVVELTEPEPFPGASVDVTLVVLHIDEGPAPLPVHGIQPEELLRLDAVPFTPSMSPGDVQLVERIRARSVELGAVAEIDTGVVAHGPEGGKNRLLFQEPGPGRVPYADARDFFAGRRKYLQYEPSQMHRAKRPELFESAKIVVQRIRGHGAVKAQIDHDGVYVGHTCTVVRPTSELVQLPRILELLQSPLCDAVVRIEKGKRLDLYPRDVRSFPLPTAWLEGSALPLEEAWGLTRKDVDRLLTIAGSGR